MGETDGQGGMQGEAMAEHANDNARVSVTIQVSRGIWDALESAAALQRRTPDDMIEGAVAEYIMRRTKFSKAEVLKAVMQESKERHREQDKGE